MPECDPLFLGCYFRISSRLEDMILFLLLTFIFFFLSTFLCPAAVCERRSFFRPSIYLFLPSIPAKSKAGLICRKSHLNFWCVFHSFSRKSRRAAERWKEHFDDYYKVSNKPSCSTAKVTKFYKVREAIFFFSILFFFFIFLFNISFYA